MNKFEELLKAAKDTDLFDETFVFSKEDTLAHIIPQERVRIRSLFHKKMEEASEAGDDMYMETLEEQMAREIKSMERRCNENHNLKLWVSFKYYWENDGWHLLIRQKGIKKPLPFKGDLDIIPSTKVYKDLILEAIEKDGWELISHKDLKNEISSLLRNF